MGGVCLKAALEYIPPVPRATLGIPLHRPGSSVVTVRETQQVPGPSRGTLTPRPTGLPRVTLTTRTGTTTTVSTYYYRELHR